MGGLLKGPDSSLDIHIVVVTGRVWSSLLLLRRSGVGEQVAEARSSRRHALYLSTMTFWYCVNPRDHHHSMLHCSIELL